MSKTIDDRIVRMSFDTSKFQNGVKGVLDGLKNIDKSLGAERKFKGLDNIGRSISEVVGKGVSSLNKSINGSAGSFSTLEIAGVTALANITNMAVNTGIKLVKSLTLDPIMDGFGEYETKMQSIQTILTNTASKGTTLSDVTKTLDELNEYADLTIYNFAAMTRNIGTFTAAGIDLERATIAIKGIANLGAGSGSTNQQVETAMYQMSQALGTGYLMLQDYNSLVNAGMGGELFKTEAIKVAKSMGIATPAIKNFRDSLKDGWLTDDVLIKVFENFANNEMLTKAATEVKTFTGLIDTLKESVGSGWAQTWESIIGDKDQATQLFTGISNAINDGLIGPMTDARQAIVDTWLEMGGRENTIKAFSNIWENLSRILGPIGAAFNKIFPKTFGQTLGHITKWFLKLTDALMIGEEFSGYIGDAFTLLFKVINTGIKIVGGLLSPLSYIFDFFVKIARVIGSTITAFIRIGYVIGNYIKELTFVKDAQKLFGNGLEFIKLNAEKFANAFDNVTKGVNGFFDKLIDNINGLFGVKSKTDGVSKSYDTVTKSATNADKALDGIKTVGDLVKRTFEGIKDAGGNINRIFNETKAGAENAVDGFIEFINQTREYISNSPLIVRATETITEAWKTMIEVGDRIKGFIHSIDFSPLMDTFNKIKDKLQPIIDYVRNIFDIFVSAFRDLFDELDLTGGQLIALLAGFAGGFGVFKILGKISDIISNILNPIGNLSDAAVGVLDGVKGVLVAYQNDIQANTLKKIGVAVLMLSGALLILSQIELDKVKTGLLGVVGILATVVTGLAVLIKITSGADLKGFFSISAAMISMSMAILNMALAVMLLSSLGMDKLSVGLLGLASGMTVMVLALGAVGTMTGTIVKGAFAMTLLANALNLMYIALTLFAKMDTQTMNNSLMSVGVALGILVLACRGLNRITGNIVKTSIGLTILSSALLILVKATKKFGELDSDVIFQGLTSITIIMAALMLFNKSTANSKMSFSMGTGMMGLAKALDMLAKPIEKFGKMKPKELAKGIGSLALVMGSLALMTNLMKPQNGYQFMVLAGGLILFSTAIKSFVNTAMDLNKLDPTSLTKGLLNIGLAIAAIGLAALVIPERQLVTLAIGIGALGLAFKLLIPVIEKAGQIPFGDMMKGFVALAGGLLILEGATRLTSESSLIMLGVGLSAIALGFTAMVLPIQKLGSIDFGTLAKGLGSLFSMIGLFTLMNMGMAGMKLIPLAAGITLLSVALSALVIPIKLMGSLDLQTIGIGLLGIAGVLAVLAAAAFIMTPLVPVLFGLATSISLLGSGMLAAAGGLTLFSGGFALFATTLGLFGDELLAFFVAFGQKLPELVESAALALIKLLEVIGQNGALITEAIYNILKAILDGIIKIVPLVANAVVDLIVVIITTITSSFTKISDAGFKLIMALLDGINKYVQPVTDKMVELLVTMATALSDNLNILITAGMELIVNLINGIAEGISANSEALSDAINNLIYSVLETAVGFGIDFFKRGFEFVVEMGKGIFDGSDDVEESSTEVAKAGVDGAESTNKEWKSAGADFSAGIEKGILSGKSGVMATATSVARSAANAIKKELDINSPSKVTTEYGMYTSKGLAVGISRFGFLAAKAGSKVAEDTARSIEKPMNNIALLDGVEFDPVIRPVMDLSNIRSGSGIIADLINGATGTISSFGSINGRLVTNVGTIQNGRDNSDIVSAISKLRRDISNIKSTTNIIEGITYDDGSAIQNTISDLVRMARVERRR